MSNTENYNIISAEDALCKEIDPELWFPQEREGGIKNSYYGYDEAKKFCAKCPLTVNCLMNAVSNKEAHGIWGGSTPRERRYIYTLAQAQDFVLKLKKRYKPKPAK